jgi:hypothetical protein
MVVVSVITTEGRFTVVIKLVSSPKSHLPACSRADSALNFFLLTQTRDRLTESALTRPSPAPDSCSMEHQAVAKASIVLLLLAIQARRRVITGEWGERRPVFTRIELGSASCSLPIRWRTSVQTLGLYLSCQGPLLTLISGKEVHPHSNLPSG